MLGHSAGSCSFIPSLYNITISEYNSTALDLSVPTFVFLMPTARIEWAKSIKECSPASYDLGLDMC